MTLRFEPTTFQPTGWPPSSRPNGQLPSITLARIGSQCLVGSLAINGKWPLSQFGISRCLYILLRRFHFLGTNSRMFKLHQNAVKSNFVDSQQLRNHSLTRKVKMTQKQTPARLRSTLMPLFAQLHFLQPGTAAALGSVYKRIAPSFFPIKSRRRVSRNDIQGSHRRRPGFDPCHPRQVWASSSWWP